MLLLYICMYCMPTRACMFVVCVRAHVRTHSHSHSHSHHSHSHSHSHSRKDASALVTQVVTENVITDKTTGFVTSKCGTHLGSYLPDDAGPRWCMDLSCIAGAAA